MSPVARPSPMGINPSVDITPAFTRSTSMDVNFDGDVSVKDLPPATLNGITTQEPLNKCDYQSVKEPLENGSASLPSHRQLPGCSAPHCQGKTQDLSHSAMRAYAAMRGPCTGDFTDPLFEWIKARDEVKKNKPSQPRSHKDVSRMLEKMDKALRSDNMGGDSPTSAVFEISKPAIGHIEPPANMSQKAIHELMAPSGPSAPWIDDEDDEEGENPSVRISPCTFLAWAEACKRWDHRHIMDPEGILAGAKRTRPQASNPNPEDHFPSYLRKARSQIDQITGEEISPWYPVPRDPTLIYSPPGIPDNAYAPLSFMERYTRMAPLDAKKRQEYLYGKAPFSVPPAGTNEYYGKTEVDEAVENMIDPMLPDGETIEDFLGSRYNQIKCAESEITSNKKAIGEQETQIKELSDERDRLRQYYIPLLYRRRAEHILRLEMEKKDARNNRIRGHVSSHVRETQYRLDQTFVRQTEAKNRRAQNARAIERLQKEIDEECLIAGKINPRDVYDELELLSSPPPSVGMGGPGSMGMHWGGCGLDGGYDTSEQIPEDQDMLALRLHKQDLLDEMYRKTQTETDSNSPASGDLYQPFKEETSTSSRTYDDVARPSTSTDVEFEDFESNYFKFPGAGHSQKQSSDGMAGNEKDKGKGKQVDRALPSDPSSSSWVTVPT